MMKKAFAGVLIALGLIIGVMGIVRSVSAQETVPQGEATDSIAVQEQETLELGDEFQNGDPIRDRTRLQALEEGVCSGACEPQQLRLHEGEDGKGTMQQKQLQHQLNECMGECDPQKIRQHGGEGGQGALQQENLCEGDAVQMRQRKGKP